MRVVTKEADDSRPVPDLGLVSSEFPEAERVGMGTDLLCYLPLQQTTIHAVLSDVLTYCLWMLWIAL